MIRNLAPKELKKTINERFVEELKKISKPCTTSKEISQVGAISANADESIGKTIAGGDEQQPSLSLPSFFVIGAR